MEEIDKQFRRVEKRLKDEQLRINKGEKNVAFWTIWIMVAIAIVTSLFVFSTISGDYKKTQQLEIKIAILSEKVHLQDTHISDIEEQVSESPQSLDVNINKMVEKLDSDYKKLQEIIIGNPANIIEFALLIKEVDSLKESYKDHKDSVYREMERSFGIFQWFIYMNIFIGLGILGMAVNIYRQSKSIQRTKDKEFSEEIPKADK